MKINYLSDSVRILIFAAAVIITCIMVALGFQAADTAKALSNNAISQMADLNNDINDSEIKMYDDMEVYGSDVVNFIKKHLGDYTETETAPIYVNVITSLSENTYRNNSCHTQIRDFTNNRYIKPTAKFVGHLIVNSNKVIVGITFTQL